MQIWAISMGEPLPIDKGTWRPWRVGVTANILTDRGHEVTWWSSTMNHHNKTNRFSKSTELPLFERTKLIMLFGRHYGRNLSWQRIANHRQIGVEFRRLAEKQPRPDVIFCALPTLEVAREAVRYGKKHGVPVVIDILDQWPDFMVELFPGFLRPIARLGLEFMYRDLREACSGAVAITGNAPALVDWGVKFSGRPATANDHFFAHGYPQVSYDENLRKKAGLFWDKLGVPADSDLPTICYIGSIRYTVIDFETVLAGFQPLSKHARLVIAGDGDDLKKLKEQAANIPNVVFGGWVDGPAVQILMQRSAIGLAPYRNSDNFKDSLTNKYAEYMSEGLPIVSSLEGFSRRLLTENNCADFFTEGNAESLTRCLRDLLENGSQRQAMGIAARKLFLANYSAEKLYEKLADFLEEMATEAD